MPPESVPVRGVRNRTRPGAAREDSIVINQDAFFSLADLEAGGRVTYTPHQPGNGVYLFVIEGSVEAAGERLRRRDALGLEEAGAVEIAADGEARVLAIEVPMG
ncbi:hypothetical protein [Thioalbus denitrificans]|uniref:Quercetin 2,3-dioxygenase C-terminal cupin domain-containing protein n=1 Tax=Thioalbus denitrificans TaxID=547122 RepID=A0A369BTN5_9GAMM|nr:hypothetical protein [Thioalbus denitrificans]RCX24741.1 hypothetical protein DFQ59_11626 [Thioalbus denitrificans]